MTINRFPYQRLNGILQPVVAIGIKLETGWQRVDCYVDSGAAYSVFQAEIADKVGFDYRTGNRINLQVGTGSLMPIYLHDLEVQLGTERFICPVGFSANLGVKFNVLGKMGIFDRFRVCFQEAQAVLTFEVEN
ncbi:MULTISPECIES: hypothetical protein [Aerosakkonema]|uniref:hypothetical protein n=1 Tax=Aerosakkonema TaxID=1246629 RepID=UPI0035B7889E